MIVLTEARKTRLASYLKDQIATAETGRLARVEVWKDALRRYEAKTIPKNFPWKNAANLHVPTVAISFDSIKARILNALFGSESFLNGQAFSEEPIPGVVDPFTGRQVTWRDIAELLAEYMSYEASPAGQVDLPGCVDELFNDVGLLGTGIVKTIWDTQVLKDPQTGIKTTVFDNVRVLVVPLEDVFFPAHYDTFDRIPWISHRFRLRPAEALANVESGWDAAELRELLKSTGYASDMPSELEMAQDGLERTGSLSAVSGEITFGETWLRFQLADGEPERQIVVTHPWEDPGCVLRCVEWQGEPPFDIARYIRRRKRLYGMGIPERLQALDEGMSTLMNQALDNITAANTRLWSVDESSQAMQALDSIWPNKKIPRSSKDDITPLQMGEVYPSIFEGYNVLTQLIEKTIKLTDYNLGRESQALGRQGTATGTLALLQESGQYFDNITRDLRVCINRVIQRWFDLIVINKPFDRVLQVLGQTRGSLLTAALQLPTGDLRKRIGIRVSFSAAAATRELARQEEMAKMQAMKEYYVGLVQMAMQRASAPIMAPLFDAIAVDMEVRIRKFLSSYGDEYSGDTLPSWERTVVNVGQLNSPTGSPAQPGMGAGMPSDNGGLDANQPPSPEMGGGGQPPGGPQGPPAGPNPRMGTPTPGATSPGARRFFPPGRTA